MPSTMKKINEKSCGGKDNHEKKGKAQGRGINYILKGDCVLMSLG